MISNVGMCPSRIRGAVSTRPSMLLSYTVNVPSPCGVRGIGTFIILHPNIRPDRGVGRRVLRRYHGGVSGCTVPHRVRFHARLPGALMNGMTCEGLRRRRTTGCRRRGTRGRKGSGRGGWQGTQDVVSRGAYSQCLLRVGNSSQLSGGALLRFRGRNVRTRGRRFCSCFGSCSGIQPIF